MINAALLGSASPRSSSRIPAPATTATAIRTLSWPRCTHNRDRYSPSKCMKTRVTMTAAIAPAHRRFAVVAGMFTVPSKSHVPATATTSTIRSRTLSPLRFRAIAGSLAMTCSTCGPGWIRRVCAAVISSVDRFGGRVSVCSTVGDHQFALSSDVTSAPEPDTSGRLVRSVPCVVTIPWEPAQQERCPICRRPIRPMGGARSPRRHQPRRCQMWSVYPSCPIPRGNTPFLIRGPKRLSTRFSRVLRIVTIVFDSCKLGVSCESN